MIAIDFIGNYGLEYSCFTADKAGKPLHPVDCECRGPHRCEYWHHRPHPKQIRGYKSKTPRFLIGGGRGGGKTEWIIWKAIFTAQSIPGAKVIIFRRTMGELRKTVIQRFLELPKELYIKCTEDAVKFDNGSVIWFGSADDEKAVRKMLSGEYVLILMDEWSEWPLSMWKFMEGSLRTPTEVDIFGDRIVAQIAGATNPGGVGGEALNHLFGCSGVKRQAAGEDPELYDPAEYEFIQSLVGDNPAYAEDTEAGRAYRKMLASQPRRVQAAWLYGRWDGFEGQYFDCLDESCTKLPHDWFLKLAIRQHWAPRWISIDWGMTHHAAVGWHALLEIQGRNYPITYRTFVTRGLGEAALAEEIVRFTETDVNEPKKIQKVYLSPETFGDTSYSRAKRIGDVFVARNLPRPIKANNKREDGWRIMHDLLRQRHEDTVVVAGSSPKTLAGWLVTDHRPDGPNNPPSLLECLAQAVCNPKKDGDVMAEGDAIHLDVNDMARYGIASHILPEDEPFADRLREELADLPMEGNARFIKHKQMEVKERQNAGVYYVGRKTWRN
jgi:hypothetical protein